MRLCEFGKPWREACNRTFRWSTVLALNEIVLAIVIVAHGSSTSTAGAEYEYRWR
jgi:hypothetical protein